MNAAKKGRALGVGVIFFRSKDPARLGDWLFGTLYRPQREGGR